MTDYTKARNWTADQGTDSDPANLDTEFDALAVASATKADLDSPAFTGTVSVPAAPSGSSPYQKDEVDTALALKATVVEVALKAPLASPTLTGNPTVPTQSTGDDSTKAASTAYVANEIAAAAAATYHNETASRSHGSDYTNTTGKEMIVHVTGSSTGTTGLLIGRISGVNVTVVTGTVSGAFYHTSFAVPNGAVYRVSFTVGTITSWYEYY